MTDDADNRTRLSQIQRKLDASTKIKEKPPARAEIEYHHSLLCQTALPYKATESRV